VGYASTCSRAFYLEKDKKENENQIRFRSILGYYKFVNNQVPAKPSQLVEKPSTLVFFH